ncbi:MAG: hemerythrin domain-containing protein [Halopseudomonas sp.]
MKIDMLKDDHHRLIVICEKIDTFYFDKLDESRIKDIFSLLNSFVEQLDAHLLCEDKYLYPYLINQTQTDVSRVASNFKNEMGDLYHAVEAYFSKWNFETALVNKIAFISELCDLMGRIRTRIRKEEAVLFPLMASS